MDKEYRDGKILSVAALLIAHERAKAIEIISDYIDLNWSDSEILNASKYLKRIDDMVTGGF